MALPRKGSRTLVVSGVRYRWMSDLPDDMLREEDRVVGFVVQRDDGAGARLRARVRWPTIVRAYRAMGKCVSKRFDRAPPFVVAEAIRIATERGWGNEGPELDAGFLEDAIDWSRLAAENQGSPRRPGV